MELSSTSSHCSICNSPAHGVHFGALTCRACAAFFRRCHFSSQADIFCRNGKEKCRTDSEKKWNCKKCRLNKCISVGMSEKNIQYGRDAFSSLVTFKNNARRKMQRQIPVTVETFLRVPHLVGFLRKDQRRIVTYLDISSLAKKACDILLSSEQILPRSLNTLEQFERGLREHREPQLDVLIDGSTVTREGTIAGWEESMCSVAKWLNSSGEIRKLPEDIKLELLQCSWMVWNKLERMAMTAQMRVNRLCGKTQYVANNHVFIEYDRMKADISWWSDYSFEELQFLFTPDDMFYDRIIQELMGVQPDSMELTYLLSTLCLGLAGRASGKLTEIAERLQETLANDLHEYYIGKEDFRYALRIKQLMRINEHFIRAKNRRGVKYEVCSSLHLFQSNISNKEFFRVSC